MSTHYTCKKNTYMSKIVLLECVMCSHAHTEQFMCEHALVIEPHMPSSTIMCSKVFITCFHEPLKRDMRFHVPLGSTHALTCVV